MYVWLWMKSSQIYFLFFCAQRLYWGYFVVYVVKGLLFNYFTLLTYQCKSNNDEDLFVLSLCLGLYRQVTSGCVCGLRGKKEVFLFCCHFAKDMIISNVLVRAYFRTRLSGTIPTLFDILSRRTMRVRWNITKKTAKGKLYIEIHRYYEYTDINLATVWEF